MKRDIITVNEDLCNGCGNCVPGCPEGALQIIDGKARLMSDLFCDGLGACLGECPTGALVIEKREAEPYEEKKVMVNIVKAGKNTVIAHLKHLKDHGETAYYNEAIDFLKEAGLSPSEYISEGATAPHHNHHKEHKHHGHGGGGCPGSAMRELKPKHTESASPNSGDAPSELTQWPVQLHLVSPNAPYYRNADLLIAADCTAFAAGNFHNRFMKGKALAIACPKLDSSQDIYVDKITAMIDEAKVNTITVAIMMVPCCGGLTHMVETARKNASRNVPIKKVIISLEGDVISEDWV